MHRARGRTPGNWSVRRRRAVLLYAALRRPVLQPGSGISFLSVASLTSRCKTNGFKCPAPRGCLRLPSERSGEKSTREQVRAADCRERTRGCSQSGRLAAPGPWRRRLGDPAWWQLHVGKLSISYHSTPWVWDVCLCPRSGRVSKPRSDDFTLSPSAARTRPGGSSYSPSWLTPQGNCPKSDGSGTYRLVVDGWIHAWSCSADEARLRRNALPL